MSIFAKLISAPVRLLNVPARALEKFAGDPPKDERCLSKPLDSLAEAIEEAVDGEEVGR